MLKWILIMLCFLGAGATYLAFVAKRAPVYTSLASAGIWLVVGYSSTAIDTVAQDGTVSAAVTSEPALAALAFGNALLSLVVTLAAAKGEFTDDSNLRPADRNEMRP